ncbi:MAG: glycoside hydrolase family 43 protein [Prevotella sp.]|nr:glycoside hydrolase family 43 protein [Prevotella sp.]
MKRSIIAFAITLLTLHAGAQLTNPILPGFHPDPSICRVGNDYYMVNSSFQYFPGVPIFHSRDLKNWEQVGNVLTRESQLKLTDATSWQGIYAPTLRYLPPREGSQEPGRYYMITTNVGQAEHPESANFLVWATSPEGPWSEPVWLKQGGIDPSLLFDDNGRCYMVSNPNNTITLCQIDPATGKQLTPSRPIWQGTGGRYPEGPHIYKKDGYYYLLISEGGTELAHSLTMARSRSIYGPYEACPKNPILTHCRVGAQDSPIQGTGHGDLVQDTLGRWWMVFLAYRNYNGAYHQLGRETFIAPVEWSKDGWPVVNGGMPIEAQQRTPVHRRYDFDAPLGPEWVYIQNPDSAMYLVHNGQMRLHGSRFSLVENKRPTFVGLRQESATFVMDTKITAHDLADGDEAGLCVYQMHNGNVQCFLANYRDILRLRVRLNLKGLKPLLVDKNVPNTDDLWLRVESDSKNYSFYYSTDGEKYLWLESIDCSLLSTETVGGFTGAMLGIYCFQGNNKYQAGRPFADFDYVEYTEQ